MRQTSDCGVIETRLRSNAVDDLAEIRVALDHFREALLDYNPLLAVMADALHTAVKLELDARRINAVPQGDPA